MTPEKPEGHTHVIGEEQGYIPLPIRQERVIDEATGAEVSALVSAWRPSPEEMTCLLNGGKVYLRIMGAVHPPVMVWAE